MTFAVADAMPHQVQLMEQGFADERISNQDALNAACMATPWPVVIDFGVVFYYAFLQVVACRPSASLVDNIFQGEGACERCTLASSPSYYRQRRTFDCVDDCGSTGLRAEGIMMVLTLGIGIFPLVLQSKAPAPCRSR